MSPRLRPDALPSLVVDVLRGATEPLSARQLFDAIDAAETLTEVCCALNNMLHRGVVNRVPNVGAGRAQYLYTLANASGEPVVEEETPSAPTPPTVAAEPPPPESFALESPEPDAPRKNHAPQTRYPMEVKRRLLRRLSDWVAPDVAAVLIAIEHDLAGLR